MGHNCGEETGMAAKIISEYHISSRFVIFLAMSPFGKIFLDKFR